MKKLSDILSVGNIFGFLLVFAPAVIPFLLDNGLSALGAILGITLIVCSLFGDLPKWINWTQKLGSKLYLGIAAGTTLLLLFFLIPTSTRESSFFAFSPAVWGAYLSIVLVTLSFRFSSIPRRIYAYCQHIKIQPYILIPLFVTVAGLLGNILDGVSIISISVVIFLGLLEKKWALRASFALLFSGLISNLITVAAEPTNIKFDEVMHMQLMHIHPYYWFTNWPISIIGILLPAITLGVYMFRNHTSWKAHELDPKELYKEEEKAEDKKEVLLSLLAVSLLGAGVVLHTVFSAISLFNYSWPLWQLLLPAGAISIIDIFYLNRKSEVKEHIQAESPVWIKLMIIFSLLWLILNIFSQYPNISSAFFLLPFPIQYFFMIILSLLSSVTDNVALASMQGSIMLQHPLAIWQMRLLFVLLTWAGGLTPFGCLQSLALNSNIKLSTEEWLKETPIWAGYAIIGGLIGLIFIKFIYPTAF